MNYDRVLITIYVCATTVLGVS